MKTLRKAGATLGLILTILPSILYFAGAMTEDLLKTSMLIGSLVWFLVVIPHVKQT